MFKKKPQIKPAAPLRSSDRRKTADSIIETFQLSPPTPSDVTPEQKAEATTKHTALRNSLLPDNVQSARFTTTHGPDLKQVSGTVYIGSHEGEDARILWWQVDGKMYPSVYTLWRNPNIVPLLHTPDIVIRKLQGGADLMTPGLAGGPPFSARAKKGAVAAIASTERPSVPVAVGVCAIEVSALEKVQGQRGHAVENLHWVGDELWSYSPSEKPGRNPPEEIEGWLKESDDRGLGAGTEELDLDEADGEGGVSLNGHSDGPSAEGQANGEHAEAGNAEDAETVQEESARQGSSEMSQKEIDDAFRAAFLYGVYHHKTTQSLAPSFGLVFPLSQSSTMSNLIQPFLPAFTPEQSNQLQMKKTSWKSIKKFVKAMDKEKLVKSKDKDGNETVIIDIDFNDPTIANFKPYRLPKKETMAGTSLGRDDKATEQIDTGDDSVGQKLQVVSYFKPTTKLQPLFASASKQLFTPPEVREIINAYIEQESLLSETNKRLVRLNPTLGNAVFDGSGSLDKEVLAKGSVPRDALIDRILHAMNTSYAIVRNDTDASAVKAKSGTPPKLQITLETRSGNKTVTKVSGLEAYYIPPRPFADELRKVCAGSTSVEPLAGATKKNEKEVMEVMIQGPQRDAVVKALEGRGVNARWVEVLDKTKKKR
ncbi:hypothetical protein BAUCODRAFT_470006 [Baudoinia panamericana UAMH 10762]|uniref:SUI1 domain-containing protein n=1 Tax=Baudoinia panamericana (strain UAMH 10762) TaxID=717646 RepID=M2MI20_BAUPA|nr:uncharacterized protein BAUCODRAFT_470006 [Baudoinia panamericana UAMH 10762]EMC96296.1 hypothetical protein BAUCODRAFT_470006 [Baudoinia panamericana UAMH 10762]